MTRDLTGSDNEVNDDVTNIRDVTRSTMTSLMKSLVNAVAPDASVPLSAQRSAMTVAWCDILGHLHKLTLVRNINKQTVANLIKYRCYKHGRHDKQLFNPKTIKQKAQPPRRIPGVNSMHFRVTIMLLLRICLFLFELLAVNNVQFWSLKGQADDREYVGTDSRQFSSYHSHCRHRHHYLEVWSFHGISKPKAVEALDNNSTGSRWNKNDVSLGSPDMSVCRSRNYY